MRGEKAHRFRHLRRVDQQLRNIGSVLAEPVTPSKWRRSYYGDDSSLRSFVQTFEKEVHRNYQMFCKLILRADPFEPEAGDLPLPNHVVIQVICDVAVRKTHALGHFNRFNPRLALDGFYDHKICAVIIFKALLRTFSRPRSASGRELRVIYVPLSSFVIEELGFH